MDHSAVLLRHYDISSADGTRIRAWKNEGDGTDVVIANGLGTNPHAWPGLLRPDSDFRVHSCYHRGIGGSERPKNGRIGVTAHVEDLIAVMDDAAIDSAVIASWSIGVNVAFELAARHPERVKGILAVCGVPGDTFSTMLAPLHLPAPVAKTLTVGFSHSAALTGGLVRPVINRLPWNRFMVDALRTSRLISSAADSVDLQRLLQEFSRIDPAWFGKLAVAASHHDKVSLSQLNIPTTLIAGTWDIMAGPRNMRTASERLPHSRFREIANATHFVPVEHPEVVNSELHDLICRVM